MNRFTKWIVGALCALALVTSTYAATNTVATAKAPAQTVQAESWVLSLGGVGAQSTDAATGGFGLDLSVGRTGHLLLPLEAGLRQNVTFADVEGETTTLFTTRLYSDWTLVSLFDKKVDLFGGAAVGLTYGNTKPLWEIAPEAGARWWIKKDVAILGRVEVPWDLADWEFKDTIRYFLGFQVKF